MKKSILVIIFALLFLSGCSKAVEKAITSDIIIDNLVVSQSEYTNPEIEAKFKNDEYFAQLNFDITNNTISDIVFDETELMINYEERRTATSSTLSYYGPGDISPQGKTLKPGETITLQGTNIVSGGATNFYVSLRSLDDKLFAKSDIIKNVN